MRSSARLPKLGESSKPKDVGNGQVAVAALRSRGVDLDAVRQSVVELVGYGPEGADAEKLRKKRWFWFGWRSVGPTIPFTPRSKRVCALAAKEAKALNHSYVGTEHLLLGLVAEGEGLAARVLASFGTDAGSLRDELLKQLDPDYRQLIHETEVIRLGEEDCPMIVVGLDRARAIAAARVVTSVGGKFEHVMSARREILAELAPCNPAEIVFHFVPLDVEP